MPINMMIGVEIVDTWGRCYLIVRNRIYVFDREVCRTTATVIERLHWQNGENKNVATRLEEKRGYRGGCF